MDSCLGSSSSFTFALTNENGQDFCYLQNGGGLGVALMENAGSFLATLPPNPTFLSAIFALFVTQSTKVFLNLFKKGQLSFRHIFVSQGMPSTRSALCSAITTSVAISHGVADSFFPVSLGFSLILICDALTVDRHAGNQAMVANTILGHLQDFDGYQVIEERLDEDIGDNLPQVLTGVLLGSTIAVLCFMLLGR